MNNLFPKPMIIAHRGASADAPENTMASFQLAIAQGAHAIELDTRLSKDGELIVLHDDTIDRTTTGHGLANELTVKELQQYDAGLWFHEKYKGEKIPTLEQVLVELPQQFIINIEIKGVMGELEGKLAKLLQQCNRVETVFISSFQHKALHRLKLLIPELRVGLGYTADIIDHIAFAKLFQPPIYSLHPHHQLISLNEISLAIEQGIEVYPYTVDLIEDMRILLEAGASGIITNYPSRMKQLLQGM